MNQSERSNAVFRMPSLGADMDSGTLVEWCVAPGDTVKRGAIVAVVETQKGAIDVETYQSGVIAELVVPVGTEVPVGTVLATLITEGEEPGVTASDAAAATPPPDSTRAPPRSPPPPPPTDRSVRLSPRARRRASELGISPASLTGTGPSGSITGEDVERAAAADPNARQTSDATSGMREAITAAMSRANREIPHYHLKHTIDLEPSLAWLVELNRERPIHARVLPITLIVRAVAHALVEYPALGGWFVDGAYVPAHGIHIGLVVSLRGGGVVNPAIRDADHGTVPELSVRIADVVERARRGGLRASEFADATITITSLGDRGIDVVHGIIHPPQVALVGFGTTRARPWVVSGRIEPRRLVEASLAADHRVTDGHLGARFLRHIADALARPEDL